MRYVTTISTGLSIQSNMKETKREYQKAYQTIFNEANTLKQSKTM